MSMKFDIAETVHVVLENCENNLNNLRDRHYLHV